MYIKTKNGDYVNLKHIGALKLKSHGGNIEVVAECVSYCDEAVLYANVKKEDAQVYMDLLVNRLREEEKAESMKVPRCAILKVSESVVDALSYSNLPIQNEPQRVASQNAKLSAMLATLVDDFAASGDTDNLLKINAYIRMYLQQEANHE